MRYYSLDRLLEADCDYNFIISGRGPGKSTAMVNHLIDVYDDHGGEFVRVARYDWETSRTLMAAWFNEVNRQRCHEKLHAVPSYKGLTWSLLDEDDPACERPFGHLVTLNNQDTFKSASYDFVENVVYEEFALLRERDYMVGEVEAFLSALSTIVRRRQNVKVWFIGNTLSKHNPFFDFFGIDVDRMGIKPGQVRKFRCAGFNGHGATVAVEFADMAEDDYMELSPLMRIGGNVTATSGLYEMDPSVTEYAARTAGLAQSEWRSPLPSIDGLYLGGGNFADIRVTKRPRYDDMCLMALGVTLPTLDDVATKRWLNLSGEFNPPYEVEELGVRRRLQCVSPLKFYADEQALRRFQAYDASCVHAYETDEIRWRWRNFVDAYGYERGSL